MCFTNRLTPCHPHCHPESGWIATVMFFSTNVGSAIVMLITALLFTVVTLLMGLVLIKVSDTHVHTRSGVTNMYPRWFLLTRSSPQVHRLYRGGGGSMQRAQEEWSTGLWKSAPVREAGFNAVAQTAQGPSLPQYPAAVPSYPDNSRW